MLESSIEGRAYNLCKQHGDELIKLQGYGNKGRTDRILIVAPWLVAFVEFKKPGEKPEPAQRVRHRRLRKKGFEVQTFDNFKDFKEWYLRFKDTPPWEVY